MEEGGVWRREGVEMVYNQHLMLTSLWLNSFCFSITSDGRNGIGMNRNKVMRYTAPHTTPNPSGLRK